MLNIIIASFFMCNVIIAGFVTFGFGPYIGFIVFCFLTWLDIYNVVKTFNSDNVDSNKTEVIKSEKEIEEMRQRSNKAGYASIAEQMYRDRIKSDKKKSEDNRKKICRSQWMIPVQKNSR